MNDLNKLLNFNPMDFMDELSDQEKDIWASVFNDQSLKDWHYEQSDNSMKLKVLLVNKSRNSDPEYQKDGDSGFDIKANLPEGEVFVVPARNRALIETGLYFQIPKGFELQIRPRSGLALKNGITVLNSPGTIDAGYRGEIMVLLYNTSDFDFEVKNGDRIAQGVITNVHHRDTVKFIKVNHLDDSERGNGGFGSTGV
jgi:dUTP pyrophosphatase